MEGTLAMFVDARQLPDGLRIEADICIIGAGAAGITMAKEFVNTAHSVCVLESGDVVMDTANQSLYEGKISGLPYTPLSAARVRSFGGTTNHWSGWCRPLDPIDFEARSWIPYSGWPFQINELQPFYNRAERLFGIYPPGFDPSNWVDAHNTALDFGNRKVDTNLFRITAPARFGDLYRDELAAAQNVTVYLHANATLLVPTGSMRHLETVKAGCVAGNRFSVMASAYVLAVGGIENARLLLASTSVSQNGVGNDNGLVGRFFMDHPGITSGAILLSDPKQSTGLYLGLKRQVSLPAKIDGGSMEKFITADEKEVVLNWVSRGADEDEFDRLVAPILQRRCITCHNPEGVAFHRRLQTYEDVKRVVPGTVGEEDAEIESDIGAHSGALAGLSLSREVLVQNRLMNYCALLEESRGWSEAMSDDSLWRSIKNVASSFGDLSIEFFREIFDEDSRRKLIRVVNVVEPSPNPASRVTLNEDKDALGMNRVTLDWRLNAQDKNTIAAAHDILARELGRSGLGRMLREFDETQEGWPENLTHGWHHMGTTRMHEDPKFGVVDANCRVHGMDNLYIAGSSVFPTYGYAQPTFTIVALAIRLSDHLKSSLV